MGALVEPGEQARAARGADRGGDKGVLEAQPIGRELVDDRRLDDRVPGAAEKIVPLIVGEEEYQVRPVGSRQLIGEGEADAEGVATMTNLGRTMAWALAKLSA